MCVPSRAPLLFVLAWAVDGQSGLPAMPPSRQELDACVSMILLQLPFPPLPVLALNGHGREAVASSHDLLSQAIAVSLLAGRSGVAGEAQKMRVLQRLNEDVAAEWVRVAAPLGGAANWRVVPVRGIYDLYCRHFRAFMACYPGSPDLRICQHTEVLPGMAPYEHAVQHLCAQETYVVGEDADEARVPRVREGVHSYEDLLRIYAIGMFADSVECRAGGTAEGADRFVEEVEVLGGAEPEASSCSKLP